MSRPPAPRAARPQLHRFPMGHLRVNIDCPSCGDYLGRCDSTETRDIALRTHAAHCSGLALDASRIDPAAS